MEQKPPNQYSHQHFPSRSQTMRSRKMYMCLKCGEVVKKSGSVPAVTHDGRVVGRVCREHQEEKQ